MFSEDPIVRPFYLQGRRPPGAPVVRSSLLAFFLGVIVTAIATCFAIHGNNVRWQCQAYEHCAAVWKMDAVTGHKSWMWLDDYFFEQLTNGSPREPHRLLRGSDLHGTPSPGPVMQTL